MTHPVFRRAAPFALVAAAFAHAVLAGWGTYGSVLIDTGRELELPRRMLLGETLYADLRWYYGPLAPWVNTTLYRLFGVHLDVLAVAGAGSAALLAYVIYRIARLFLPSGLSTVVTIGFVYLCAFRTLNQSAIFNFVLPYTFAASYGMLAAAASLLFLVKHARSQRLDELGASLLFGGLAALAKLEVAVPVIAAHGVFLIAALADRRFRRPQLLSYAAAAVAVAAVYAAIFLHVGPALWSENLAAVANAGSQAYVAKTMGFGDPIEAARGAGISFVLLAIALAGAGAGAILRQRGLFWSAGGSALSAGAAFAAFRLHGVEFGFRLLPVAFSAALVVCILRFLRDGGARERLRAEMPLYAFALASLLRIALQAGPSHYGFYLLPVPLVAFTVLAAKGIPAAFAKPNDALRVSCALAAAGILTGASVDAHSRSVDWYAAATTDLSGPRGTIRVLPTAAFAAPILARLRSRDATTCVMVIPQGATLPYLAGLRTCDLWFSYLPMEISGENEVRLVAHWLSSPPDVAIGIRGELRDFDSKGFGVDYATGAARWLGQHYRLSETIGPALLTERVRDSTSVAK